MTENSLRHLYAQAQQSPAPPDWMRFKQAVLEDAGLRQHATVSDDGLRAEIQRLSGNYRAAARIYQVLHERTGEHRYREQFRKMQRVAELEDITRCLQRNRFSDPASWQNLLEALGTGSRRFAWRGPWKVEIKLTNRCNNDCLGCSGRSPLMSKTRKSDEWLNQEIPLAIALRLIAELAGCGVRVIRLSGGGEPLLYPHIREILQAIRGHGIMLHLITNGTLLTEDLLEQMMDMKMYGVGISLWAGTEATYLKNHPNRRAGDFTGIVDRLHYYRRQRRPGRNLSSLSLIQVLNNLNYHEVELMYELARDVGAECIHFTMMSPVIGETDCLCLNPEQMAELGARLRRIAGRAARDGIGLFGMAQFAGDAPLAPPYRRREEVTGLKKVPCTIGWTSAIFDPAGDVWPCVERGRPIGNFYRDSFPEIWNDEPYQRFRLAAYPAFDEAGEYYRDARCWIKCDHYEDENRRYYETWLAAGPAPRIAHRWVEGLGRLAGLGLRLGKRLC